MSDKKPIDAKYEGLRRGLRSRRRDDHALDLFRQIEANLADTQFVGRMLLELSRCYNPLTNGPIVRFDTRRAIVELLEAGNRAQAERLLNACLAEYAPPEAPKASPAAPGELPLRGEQR